MNDTRYFTLEAGAVVEAFDRRLWYAAPLPKKCMGYYRGIPIYEADACPPITLHPRLVFLRIPGTGN